MIQEIGSIIEGCKRGEIKSQTSLFHTYKKKWMGVCVRYVKDNQEAQDVFQDAAISLFREIKTLKDTDAFEGWARRIFVNYSLNFLRKKKRYVVMLQDYTGHHEDDFIDDVQVARELDTEELLKVIGRLPDGYRLVLNLALVDGYKHGEIAKMLSISTSTSRSQLNKARKYLQRLLENQRTAENARIAG